MGEWGKFHAFVFALSALGAGVFGPQAWAENCSGLGFELVEPVPAEIQSSVSCSNSWDRSDCQLKKAFAKIDHGTTRAGKSVYFLKRAPLDPTRFESFRELVHSPAIREVNTLRIQAREVVGVRDACEPNYLYLGSRKVFGVGPAFISSTRFSVEGKPTANFIVAEGARLPVLPLKALTPEALTKNHYFDIAIAHEIAHGIMQDLYGVDAFSRLEGRVTSRNGHFASAVTDPRLAWIEGFAEGFEAFLGERYLRPSELFTPAMDDLVDRSRSVLSAEQRGGIRNWFEAIGGGALNALQNFFHTDDLVADFLKAERQRPIRENHYIVQGLYSNLSHRYDLLLAWDENEQDALAVWETERDESVWSKEGVVAHIIYAILSAGLESPMFRAIAESHPADLSEFLNAFLPKLDESQSAKIAPALKSSLSEQGRKLTRDFLKAAYEHHPEPRKDFASKLAAVLLPSRFPSPREQWVEYANTSPIHGLLYGRMDRLNLITASPSQWMDLIVSLPIQRIAHDDARQIWSLRKRLLNQVLLVRSYRYGSLQDFADWQSALKFEAEKLRRWHDEGMAQAIEVLAKKIQEGHALFLARAAQ